MARDECRARATITGTTKSRRPRSAVIRETHRGRRTPILEGEAGGVASIAKGFRISRPAISQHLKVLKHAGLVVDHAEGTRRIYGLNPAAFASLSEYFNEFWDLALQSFARRVESRITANDNE